MRRTIIVLATAVSMATLPFAAAGSAAGTQPGDTYSTGFEAGSGAARGFNTLGSITGAVGVANAAAFAGGPIDTVCAGGLNAGTFTLTADCGPTTKPITVPSTITTVNGGNFTISATDIGFPQFAGAILTNASAGQTMNIRNLTVTGPVTGFQLPAADCAAPLYGIYFNDASGSVDNVTVDHLWQQQGPFGSCQSGRAIRADGVAPGRTVTITNTRVRDYQKSGFEARGTMTMNLSGSTAGPSHPLEELIAQNGVSIVGAAGTVEKNTIFGSGYTRTIGGPGASTAVLLFGAHDVKVTNNTLTSPAGRPGTDIGISVAVGSTDIVIGFNKVNRLGPDIPDDVGIGIDVNTPDDSTATLICNTFNKWQINVVGAEQIACTPPPKGIECLAYSAPAPDVESGKNYKQTQPFNIIDATPFTWTVQSGTLPPGLSLSSAGAITGTPTAAGTFKFTLKVVDSTGLTDTQAQIITIAPDGCPTMDKEADSPMVTPGGLAGYRITVTNRSRRHIARNLWICDRIPRNMTFVRATRRLLVFRRMRCLVIARLLPRRSTSFHLTLRVGPNANGTETNTAEVIPGPPSGGGTPETPETPDTKPPPVKKPTAKARPIAKAKARVAVRHRAHSPRFTG
jgi:uncharacterized repeat protein (TIGR01451 family)